MKIKRVFNIVFVVSVIFFCAVIESFAFNDQDAVSYLWRLINDARARPCEMMEKYEIDITKARGVLGDKEWVLDLNNGLPPLAWNGLLSESAYNHSRDMIDHTYYDYTSQDGRTFNDRISATEYQADKTGENLGLLYFENIYVDPIEAVEKIFVNMLRDELNSDIDHPENIFSIEFTEIGLSFISTVFYWEDFPPLNVYIVTVDFARPVELRRYAMGNIYNVTPVDPDTGEVPDQLQLLSAGLAPEKGATGSLFVDYLKGEDPISVETGSLGVYQVETSLNDYFTIHLYDDSLKKLKSSGGIGLNINQMIDLRLNQEHDDLSGDP